VLMVYELKFWLWLNPKVIRVCYWAAGLSYRVGDYQRMENLYRIADGLCQNQRELLKLLRFFTNPRVEG